jgi:hypothetical protein
MLNVIMMSVIILSIVMLNVVVPKIEPVEQRIFNLTLKMLLEGTSKKVNRTFFRGKNNAIRKVVLTVYTFLINKP